MANMMGVIPETLLLARKVSLTRASRTQVTGKGLTGFTVQIACLPQHAFGRMCGDALNCTKRIVAQTWVYTLPLRRAKMCEYEAANSVPEIDGSDRSQMVYTSSCEGMHSKSAISEASLRRVCRSRFRSANTVANSAISEPANPAGVSRFSKVGD
jgi:hypothetical protein